MRVIGTKYRFSFKFTTKLLKFHKMTFMLLLSYQHEKMSDDKVRVFRKESKQVTN